MNVSETFDNFLENLRISNEDVISDRYKRITKTLNKEYRELDDDTKFSLYGGSYGRDTAIDGTSDVDMLMILPADVYTRFDNYQGNGQSALLQEVKGKIKKTYPKTEISGDGQVVSVSFNDMDFEVVPVFELDDEKFKFANSNDGGSWEVCNPRAERDEINKLNNESSKNLKRLCRMVRAWKNQCGVPMSGMLIDTLCYNFVSEKIDSIKVITKKSYDTYIRDYFEWLKDLDDDKEYWLAPGSRDKIYNDKGSFGYKAKKAYETICDAISKSENATVNNIWRDVFGNKFPNYVKRTDESAAVKRIDDNEEFIEERYSVDIRYALKIDCTFFQEGFRERSLRGFLKRKYPLTRGHSLKFSIVSHNIPEPFELFWKVRNIGPEAEARNCLRGQITRDTGNRTLKESSNFWGSHFVEAYAVKGSVCVAKDRINVPIC